MTKFQIKDPGSFLTHFIGFIASCIGLGYLIQLSYGDTGKLVTAVIYGVSLILLYAASSTYHMLPVGERFTKILKKIDHAAIFILIAGSYTPICYIALSGKMKVFILSLVWISAAIGILLKIFTSDLPRKFSTALYIMLGWIAVIPFYQFVQVLSVPAILLMVLGGVLYTIGGYIYATKKLDWFPNRFGFHEVFHLFVMGGSITHFIMVAKYVIPLTTM